MTLQNAADSVLEALHQKLEDQIFLAQQEYTTRTQQNGALYYESEEGMELEAKIDLLDEQAEEVSDILDRLRGLDFSAIKDVLS